MYQLRRKQRKEWERRKARKGAYNYDWAYCQGRIVEVETKGPRDTRKDRNGQLYAQTRDKRGTRVDRYIHVYIGI